LSKNEGVLLNGKGNLKNSDRGLFITHRYLSSTQSPQVVLRLNCNVDNQLGGVVAAHGTPQRTKNRTGFYYRVPVMVESTLMLQIPGAIYTSSIDGERGTPITPHPVLAYSALSIPQWGPARYLPRRTGS
jgi:hypothetical protein